MTNTMTLQNAAMLPRLLAVGAALAASLVLGSRADAQPPGGRGGRGGRGGNPEQMVERRVEHLTTVLQLSEQQAAQIRTILTDEHAKIAALRPDQRPATPPDSATRARMRETMQSLREETNDRIEFVLTAEQRTRYAELAKDRGPGGRLGRGRGGPGGPGMVGGRGGPGGPRMPGGRGGDPDAMIDHRVARLTEVLSLDANQATSIRGILTEAQNELAALRPSGRPAQRPDSATIAEQRARVDAIHDRTDERIESVLTPEQRAKFATLRDERSGRGGPGRGGFGGPGRGGFRGQRPPPPPAA